MKALTHPQGRAAGVAAALAAALAWGAALALTRLGVAGPGAIAPADLAALRFLPAALLAPFLARRLRWPGFLPAAILVMGGGAPFVLLVASAMRLASAAEAGVLLPGAFPLFVALLARLEGVAVGPLRAAGLGLVGVALGVGAWPSLQGGALLGPALLLLAAFLSAGYAVALRRSGLDAVAAASFVGAASSAALIPLLLATGSTLATAPAAAVLTQALIQGGISGLLAPVLFSVALARLGAPQAAAFGALTPGAAALFGFVLLGEVPAGPALAALLAAGLGVAMANLAAPARLSRASA
ncbi:MAG: DMT family transporter [Acetobacteraceae bacterium]|jgi:drug/metabolite transporter (DMT)-like permease|nr:DMT family transporter [Acetobacteraceae bacterium]